MIVRMIAIFLAQLDGGVSHRTVVTATRECVLACRDAPHGARCTYCSLTQHLSDFESQSRDQISELHRRLDLNSVVTDQNDLDSDVVVQLTNSSACKYLQCVNFKAWRAYLERWAKAGGAKRLGDFVAGAITD